MRLICAMSLMASLIALSGDRSHAAVGDLDTKDRFPFVVQIHTEAGSCSGVVGNSGILVGTAAHCLYESESGYVKEITIVYTDADGNERSTRGERMIVPSEYGPRNAAWKAAKATGHSFEANQKFEAMSRYDIGFVLPAEPIATLGRAYWVSEVLAGSLEEECSIIDALYGQCAGQKQGFNWNEAIQKRIESAARDLFGNYAGAEALIVGYGQSVCRQFEGADCVSDWQRRIGAAPLLDENPALEPGELDAPYLWKTGSNTRGVNPLRHGDSGGATFVRSQDGRWIFVGYNSGGSGRWGFASSLLGNLHTWYDALDFPTPSGLSEYPDGHWNLAVVASPNWARKQGQRFLAELMEVLSLPADQATLRLQKIYGNDPPQGSVDIDNPRPITTKMRDKWLALVQKFPSRYYRIAGKPDVDCQPRARIVYCKMTAAVDWRLTDAEGTQTSGTNRYYWEANLGGTGEMNAPDTIGFHPQVDVERELDGAAASTTSSKQVTRLESRAFPYGGEDSHTVSSIDACEEHCLSESSCIAYTYFKDRQLCRLMTQISGPARINSNAASGKVRE